MADGSGHDPTVSPPCAICGGPTGPAFSTPDRNRRLTSARFDYFRCAACGTLALVNVPADLAAYYPPDYYRIPSSRTELLAAGAGVERAKLELLRPFVPGRHLLEIGPAIGAFLAVAQDQGYDTAAIEMDDGCCTFLEAELGVRTTRSDDPIAALAGLGRFDVIAMWQVIEHLPDPAGMIAGAARALSPNGVLAISAPNPAAFQARVFGARWTHIDAPRHRFLIPLEALEALGASQGLTVVLDTTADASARNWTTFGWRESLANATRARQAAAALRLTGSAIARALAPLERRGRRGATYTVLMQRRAD